MNEILIVIANLMESWKDRGKTGKIVVTITVSQGGVRELDVDEKTSIKLKK